MALVAALLLSLAGGSAWSQTNRTIKIVVAVPPGGNTDIVARVLADQIGRAHGPAMVIENRPGAGSAIATEAVARAAPDGNTLLIAGNSFVVNPHLRKVNYDPLASFEPICYLVTSPTVIVVNAASPYRTLTDLINAARAKPGDLTLASVGPGSAAHIAIEILKRAADVNLTFVPYPGTAPAVNALLGEHVTSVLANVTDVVEQVKAGGCARLPPPHGRGSSRCPMCRPSLSPVTRTTRLTSGTGCSHRQIRRKKSSPNSLVGSPPQ
jgi:tripartite-type tricarboxylate transporter receptor subunit TctC